MRLIDAETLRSDMFHEAFEKDTGEQKWDSGLWIRFKLFERILDMQTEHYPIVRCNDCIYWDKGHTEECNNSGSICFHNGWCEPDWFCADGERKQCNA